jgi:hypothetical protein
LARRYIRYGGKGDLGDAKLKRGDETAGEEAEEAEDAGSNFAARVSINCCIKNKGIEKHCDGDAPLIDDVDEEERDAALDAGEPRRP